MNEARAKRILDELQKQGVSQMLLTDPMSIYYLTGVSMAPIERFYALLLRADGHHAYFLNHLFHVPQEVGVEKVWYSDTDPVAEIVAAHLDMNAVLGVDKDLKARFLLPLMEMNAADAWDLSEPWRGRIFLPAFSCFRRECGRSASCPG